MKIDSQDIIRTAQQLRDKQNDQLSVRPWNRQRHFHVPTWLVAIPAAAIIGFALGLWTQSRINDDTPLTALTDTVYIKIPVPQPKEDSVAQSVINEPSPTVSQASATPKPTARPVVRQSAVSTHEQPAEGRSVADDHIRYDLLVRN